MLIGVSAWLGASVVNWHSITEHPVGPALVFGLVVVAIVMGAWPYGGRRRGWGRT